ncbi:NAD(P)H:quinone oxidoreductase, type IV [Carnobacterium divergens]|uniref:flavodoxin family protein n=1 Tax=Carnobacterium divergens TaxID=2748 RepID=UPI001072E45F|nr:NAD(P)H-dependent oxidoreductase [Carnobacterium divergens]TFJ39068.1 NAD(P)H:quinone oxidoreductase, type IV [Carnobacterium divergens]TFJ48303.1 NAD(P)H:quinone oxidoreductase, type IV [Carnobacterium divergens]TFJ53267.1 NAD(P)H:quinone oxidoreductase, type IV [Carnobacterium divergens]TFJ57354.1 NAD(P)H:quinone oxidoreductase, type IV [Carnobacterium divergens]TFJ69056.1 NAD(P)H:quinone oxidoreductase, type IV [Carnobacterium divergens]
MSNTKIAVIYYSSTGGNTQMARWAADAAKEVGAEVRLLKAHELAPDVAIDSNPLWRKNVNETADIPEATSADLEWADGIIFSSPSRFGVMASQLKQFIDLQGGLWAQGKLANKAVTAMATAGNPHGGQEEVIQSIYTVMQHWSTILIPTGYINKSTFGAGGNPYGSSATISQDGEVVDAKNIQPAVADQAKRLVQVATALKNGL